MAEIEKDPTTHAAGGNLNVQTENIAFDPARMVACGECGRMNPPTRLACLYCGRELEIDPDSVDFAKLTLRKPEDWEPGFSVILLSEIDPNGQEVATISKITLTAVDSVRSIAATRRPMPILRVGSQTEAGLIRDALERSDIRSTVISDESLMPDHPPTRLRAVEFRDASIGLTSFNTGEQVNIICEDLVLIVKGSIDQTAVDQIEKKRRGKESKLLEAVEASSDMPILDLYANNTSHGFRITTSGFDFSCLGNDKVLLAVENINRIAERLRQLVPNAKFADDYFSVRHALADVWEIDRRKDSRGMQRSGFGKVEFGNTVSTSNLRQMNKFSRLQFHLL
jgi:hypothetical protein